MNERPREVLQETAEQRITRIDQLWAPYTEIAADPELMALFERKRAFSSDREPNELLEANGYPARSSVDALRFETWEKRLNPKFIKDGYMYLLRGDHPGLSEKGFYTRTYGYAKTSTEQLQRSLKASSEAGYFVYGDERYLTTVRPDSSSIAEQLAQLQSRQGGSSFVSATTSISCAQAGTGNNPDPEEQKNYHLYVLKIPIDAVINSDTGNWFGLEEDEYLVPDYIKKEEIIAEFPRNQTEEVYRFLQEILDIDREDLRMKVV